MYEFFDRLVATALPRIRDFREIHHLQPNSVNLDVVSRALRPTASISLSAKDADAPAKPNVARAPNIR